MGDMKDSILLLLSQGLLDAREPGEIMYGWASLKSEGKYIYISHVKFALKGPAINFFGILFLFSFNIAFKICMWGHIWRSEDSIWEFVLFFFHLVGPGY